MSYQLAEIFKDTNSPYPNKKTAMEALGNQCVCYIESYKSWYRVNVTNWRLVSGVQWTFFTSNFFNYFRMPAIKKMR